MRKLGYYILLLMALTIFIPLMVIGGIGPGIKIPAIINKIPFVRQSTELPDDKLKNSLTIKVFVASEKKIVEMPFEEYILGVVAAEVPAKFDMEALKAQAIAARTYAVEKMIVYGGKGCSNHPGADICSEIHCQAWISKEERFKYWSPTEAVENWKKIYDAVSETSGMVIAYQGKLASGIKYFSTSGGKTESSINAFGYSEPYLVSVDSPNEEESPSFSSKEVLSKKEFIDRIKKLDKNTKISQNKLANQIKILNWTEGGRVKTIKVGDKTFSGIDIRWAMGLKSADFNIKVDNKNVTFNVKGSGHGVGMSQWGANEMGKRGKKYVDILKHYYRDTDIVEMDKINLNQNNRG